MTLKPSRWVLFNGPLGLLSARPQPTRNPLGGGGGGTGSNITRAKVLCVKSIVPSPLCQVHCGFCLRALGLVGCPLAGP